MGKCLPRQAMSPISGSRELFFLPRLTQVPPVLRPGNLVTTSLYSTYCSAFAQTFMNLGTDWINNWKYTNCNSQPLQSSALFSQKQKISKCKNGEVDDVIWEW